MKIASFLGIQWGDERPSHSREGMQGPQSSPPHALSVVMSDVAQRAGRQEAVDLPGTDAGFHDSRLPLHTKSWNNQAAYTLLGIFTALVADRFARGKRQEFSACANDTEAPVSESMIDQIRGGVSSWNLSDPRFLGLSLSLIHI